LGNKATRDLLCDFEKEGGGARSLRDTEGTEKHATPRQKKKGEKMNLTDKKKRNSLREGGAKTTGCSTTAKRGGGLLRNQTSGPYLGKMKQSPVGGANQPWKSKKKKGGGHAMVCVDKGGEGLAC